MNINVFINYNKKNRISTYKKLVVLFFILISFNEIRAQDPLFTQPSAGNVTLNTALAGSESRARLTTIYCNQWPRMYGTYVTSSVNFYQYIPYSNGFGGFQYLYDIQAETIFTKTFSFFYSQNFQIKEVLIRPSLQMSYCEKRIDWNKLTFEDVIDPKNDQSSIINGGKKQFYGLNVGLITYYKKFLLGLSAKNINRSNQSLFTGGTYRLPIRYGIQGSYLIDLGKANISPYAHYNYQNAFQEFSLGLDFMFLHHYNFAIATRFRDNINFNLGYHHKFFAINYSYNMTVSKLGNSFSGGSHEIGLIGKFWHVEPKKKFTEIMSVFSR